MGLADTNPIFGPSLFIFGGFNDPTGLQTTFQNSKRMLIVYTYNSNISIRVKNQKELSKREFVKPKGH